MKLNELIESCKENINLDIDYLRKLDLDRKQLCELLVYCHDRHINIDQDLIEKIKKEKTLIPTLDELRMCNTDSTSFKYYVWVERENGCPFGGVTDGFWVWHNDYLKIADFIICYTKERLMELCLSYGMTDTELAYETIDSLCKKICKVEIDFRDLESHLKNFLYSIYNGESDGSFKTNCFYIEKILRKCNLDVRIFAFNTIYEARALLYAHGTEYEADNRNFDELFYNDELV